MGESLAHLHSSMQASNTHNMRVQLIARGNFRCFGLSRADSLTCQVTAYTSLSEKPSRPILSYVSICSFALIESLADVPIPFWYEFGIL